MFCSRNNITTTRHNNFIVRINSINYTVQQVAKANLSGAEEQLTVKV